MSYRQFLKQMDKYLLSRKLISIVLDLNVLQLATYQTMVKPRKNQSKNVNIILKNQIVNGKMIFSAVTYARPIRQLLRHISQKLFASEFQLSLLRIMAICYLTTAMSHKTVHCMILNLTVAKIVHLIVVHVAVGRLFIWQFFT